MSIAVPVKLCFVHTTKGILTGYSTYYTPDYTMYVRRQGKKWLVGMTDTSGSVRPRVYAAFHQCGLSVARFTTMREARAALNIFLAGENEV